MAKDPVCGMEVDPSKTPYKSLYKGRVYHFCCPACKSEFEKNPDRYATGGSSGAPEGCEC